MADLLAEAAATPADADGLIALPYLLGERAPWWKPNLSGALLGLRYGHDRATIVRALVEGVAQQLALVRDSMLSADAIIDVIRATGGALHGGPRGHQPTVTAVGRCGRTRMRLRTAALSSAMRHRHRLLLRLAVLDPDAPRLHRPICAGS